MAFDDLLKEIDAHIASAEGGKTKTQGTYNRALPPQVTYVPMPEAAPESSGFISSNLKKGFATAGQAVGGALEFAGAKELGQETTDYWKRQQEQYEKERPSMTSKDITGVGSGVKFVGENVLKMVPLAIPAIAAGAGGGALAAATGLGRAGITTAAALGGFGANLATETGIITSETDRDKPLDRTQILKGAVPAAILETIPEMVGFARTGLGKTGVNWLAKKYGPEAAKAAEEVAKTQGFWKGVRKVGKDLALTTTAEGMTESAQTPLEAWGAGKPVFKEGKSFEQAPLTNTIGALTGGMVGGGNFTPEMQSEMFESGLAGAAGGFGMGAGGHVVNKAANLISDKKTETSLKTDAPTQEVVTPETAPADFKWTPELVAAQVTPEMQERAQTLMEEQEAYANSPEGIQEQEDQKRETWRSEFFQRNGGTPEKMQAKIDGEYKRISAILDVPASYEAAVARGEDVDALAKQREWMRSDETIASSSKAITKEREDVVKEQVKAQEELTKEVEKRQKELDDFHNEMLTLNEKIKEEKNVDNRKVMQREASAIEAQIEAKSMTLNGMVDPTRQSQTAWNPEANIDVPTVGNAPIQGTNLGEGSTGPATVLYRKEEKGAGKIVPTDSKLGVRIKAQHAFNKTNKTNHNLNAFTFTKDSSGNLKAVLKTHTAELAKEKTGTASIVKGGVTATPVVKVEKAPVVKKEKVVPAPSKPFLRKRVAKPEIINTEVKPKPTIVAEKVVTKPLTTAEQLHKDAEAGMFKTKQEEVDQRTSKEGFKVEHVDGLVKHLLGPKARVTLVNDTHIKVVRPDGRMIDVPAAFINDTITLATQSGTLYENVRHETIHAAKQMDLFEDGEWAVLNAKANKWIKEFGIRERYKGLSEEELREEAIARAFEVRPTENALFKRLQNFFEKIINFLRGLGYESAESVFDKLDEGAFAQRDVSTGLKVSTVLASIPMDIKVTDSNINTVINKFFEATGLDKPATKEEAVSVIKTLKELPKAIVMQNFLGTAADINNLDVVYDNSKLFFKENRTLSYAQLLKVPKEKRVAALMEALGDSAPRSLIVTTYKKAKAIEGRTTLTDKQTISRRYWRDIERALSGGNYYDGTENSFHAYLSALHNEAKTKPSWDTDNAIFAFLHTGLSDAALVPELFLPKAPKVSSEAEQRRIDSGEKSPTHILLTDTLKKAMLNGYRHRLGLDMDNKGLYATPIPKLISDSRLLQDVVDIASPKNVGTLIKLSDYANSSDRNAVSMYVLRHLEYLGAVRIYDMDTRGTDSLKLDKHTKAINVRKHADSFQKDRTSISEFLAGVGKGELTTDLSKDTLLGDTYVEFNPEFFSNYAAMGSLEKSAEVTIDKIFKSVGVGYKRSTLHLMDAVVKEYDRKQVYNAIKQNPKNTAKLMESLIQLGVNNFKQTYAVSDTSTLDNALIKAMHDKLEGKSLFKSERKTQNKELASLATVRTINGFDMPVQYSAALYLVAQEAFTDFKNSAAHNTTINTELGRKEYHASGEAKLYKAIGALLTHKAFFNIPIYGNFDVVLGQAVDFFKGNGNILDKVTRKTIFKKSSTTTITDKTFNQLIPVITPLIMRELGIINKFGLPESSTENPSLIQRLERTVDVQTDLKSSYKSVDELLDSMLEESTDEAPVDESSDDINEEDQTEEETVAGTEEESVEEEETAEKEEEEEEPKKMTATERKQRAALNKFVTMLKKRNDTATQVVANESLHKEVQSNPILITESAKVQDKTAFWSLEYEKAANTKYNILVAAAEELRDSESLTKGERTQLIDKIKELSKQLNVEFKTKDVRIDREVRINLGSIFARFGDAEKETINGKTVLVPKWTPEQKKALVERLEGIDGLVASIVYGASRKLQGNAAVGDARLGLQIFPSSTENAAGTKNNYLNIIVAEDVTNLDPSSYDKGGNVFTYKHTIDDRVWVPRTPYNKRVEGASGGVSAKYAIGKILDLRDKEARLKGAEELTPEAYEVFKARRVLDTNTEDVIETPTYVNNELPTGTMYKERGKGGSKTSIRVIPTSAGYNPNTWVQFEEVNILGDRIGKVRTMLRTVFDKRFVPNKTATALKTHQDYKYDAETAREIDVLKAKYGSVMSPIIGELFDFFAARPGVRGQTLDKIKEYLNTDFEGSPFTFENYKKSGITSDTELKFRLESIFKDMIDSGFLIKEGSDYTAQTKLTKFYKGLLMGAKTQAKINMGERTIAAMSRYNSQHTMLQALKQMVQGVKEFELLKVIKGLVIVPWSEARAHNIYKKIMATGASKSEKRSGWFSTFVKDPLVDKVAKEHLDIKENDPVQFAALNQLITEGDKLKIEFKTLQQAQEISPTLSNASFIAYKNLREMINKVLPKKMDIAGAHIYTEWATQRFDPEDDHLFSNAFKEIIAGKGHTNFSKDQINGITDSLLKLIEQPALRETTRGEMRNAVKGYIAWLEEKRAFTAATPGWMPRIRYVKDWVGQVKNAVGDLTHFNYFNTQQEAQAFADKFATAGSVASVEKTDADTRRLFSSLDKVRGLESISAVDNFLKHGMSENIGGTPNFGIGVLDSEGAGGVHLQKRVKGLVEGYENSDYLTNYLNSFSRMANAFGQLQYGLAQRENLMTARELSKTIPEVKEKLATFTRHLQLDLAPAEALEGVGRNLRSLTVLTFMGFRLLPAIINATQPFIVGVPMLARRLSEASGDSYSTSLGKAISLTRIALRDAYKDLHANVLSKEETKMGKFVAKALGASLDEVGVERHTIGLFPAEEVALKEFYKYNVATQSLAHASSIINDYKEEALVAKEKLIGLVMHKVVDNSMTFMRLTEQLNRTASFLAAYRAQPSGVKEKDKIRLATEFVNESQFMNTAFNMPINVKEMGPTGRAIMTLGMYPLHLLNAMYHELGTGPNGIKAVLLILGMTMMLGGGAALPFKDLLDLIYSKSTGRNFGLDTRAFVKNLTSSDVVANVAQRGLPTLLGVDVSANVSMPTPFIGGWIADKSIVESGTGAVGGLINRYWSNIMTGDPEKIIGALLPEAIASPVRAYKGYTEGLKTKGGTAQMYQGKPLTLDMKDFALSIVGFKSSHMGEVQEKRQAIRNLEKQYKSLAADAIKLARETGDMSKVQNLNKLILKNNLSALFKPVKVSKERKESKGKTLYENSI